MLNPAIHEQLSYCKIVKGHQVVDNFLLVSESPGDMLKLRHVVQFWKDMVRNENFILSNPPPPRFFCGLYI